MELQVFAFIDTNVLLHYEFFRDVNWAAELGVPEVTLVFSPVVLSELDQHKWTGSRREKARAKAVLKAIDELGLSASHVRLREGVWVLAVVSEPEDFLFATHRLQVHISDDRLLASLLGFREGHAEDRVLILTADSGLRVKARSRQIEVVAPADRLESPEEPDEVERELATVRRELAATMSASPNLRLTLEGESHMEREVNPVYALEDNILKQLIGEWRAANPGRPLPRASGLSNAQGRCGVPHKARETSRAV